MTESEQRHFEVLLEQVLHEVKTVAEGHSALDEKMDRFHKEANEDHRLAMELIKFSHDELKKELQSVDHRSFNRLITAPRSETRRWLRSFNRLITAPGSETRRWLRSFNRLITAPRSEMPGWLPKFRGFVRN